MPESLDALRAELEERLRFETFLAETSAHFVNIPPDRIDGEIETAQWRMCEFLGLDRSALWLAPDPGGPLQLTHIFQVQGSPQIEERPSHWDMFPWTWQKVQAGETVVIRTMADLPPEAGRDRESYSRFGTRATVVCPLAVGGGPVFGALSFAVTRTERDWSDPVVKGFQLVGQVFANALARQRADEAIKEGLRFEQLLSGLSAGFVNIPPDRVDAEIDRVLRRIMEFFQIDRCMLIQVFPDRASWQITHFAHTDGLPPIPEGVELPRSLDPWAYDRLAYRREPVVFSKLEDLPSGTDMDRQTWAEWGVRSLLALPVVVGESVGYVISISTVKEHRAWPEGLISRLNLLGETLANALGRKVAEEASRESERTLRQNEHDLRRLAGRLIDAHEEERSRIARELHDDLAQRLAVLAIGIGGLEKRWVGPTDPVMEELRELKNGIVGISRDVHSLSRQLHPSILDDLGLIKAVESECAGVAKREGLEVIFRNEGMPLAIPQDLSLHLYRIVQEGLRNISKHACAEHASVSLRGLDFDVFLSIEDDGLGFEWAEVRERTGLGFLSMRERARLIHGDLAIQSRPNQGTVITLRAPLAGRENG